MSGTETAARRDRRKTVETVTWALIYGGLVSALIGIALRQYGSPTLAWGLIAVGALAAVVGVGLIGLRSRMPDPRVPPAAKPPPRPGP